MSEATDSGALAAVIAITPGEPAGIGPDILLQAAQRQQPCRLVAIADADMLRQRASSLGLDIAIELLQPSAQPAPHRPGLLQLIHQPLEQAAIAASLDPANAPYVLSCLDRAVEGCLAGTFAAMVTGPVQKSVINDAGIPFSGHTEYLAKATATDQVVMMLAIPGLRVALATTHLPLAQVPQAINGQLLESTLEIVHRDLRQKFGLPAPRIAVLGLNPHAGEGGHMGREEIETIIPALERLRQRGMNLLGPLPADTAFNPKVLREVDAVFAMYHDQGLPVLKYAGFGEAVNITLGLPIIRTSVDHGTALDLAGRGGADPASLQHALDTALQMACGSGDPQA